MGHSAAGVAGRRPLLAVSSGPLGGGIGVRHWVVNATVPMSYHRDDPAAHLAELADRLGLDGPGVGLLTGVDVAEVVTRADTGVRVWATVGLGTPSGPPPRRRAAQPGPRPAGPPPATAGPGPARRPGSGRVGTVNIVVYVPAAARRRRAGERGGHRHRGEGAGDPGAGAAAAPAPPPTRSPCSARRRPAGAVRRPPVDLGRAAGPGRPRGGLAGGAGRCPASRGRSSGAGG